MSGVIYTNVDAFGQFRVKEMKEGDFWLGSKTPIALKSEKVHILLFYDIATAPPAILEIFNRLSQVVAGPVIGAVNMSARTEVMEAFQNVRLDVDNPLHAYTRFAGTTIICYRNSWPQAFYNGEWSFDALHKWITSRAVIPGYKEDASLFSGVTAVDEEEEIVDDNRIENYSYPLQSRDFTSNTGQAEVQDETVEETVETTEDNNGEVVQEEVQDVGYIDE